MSAIGSKSPAFYLARVGDHNGRRASLGQLALKRREIEPADIVSCQAADVRSPQAEHPDRLHRTRVEIPA
jgi:hypothetical protein